MQHGTHQSYMFTSICIVNQNDKTLLKDVEQ